MGLAVMSDAPRQLPPKKEVALALLEREASVFIHLDPRRPGVAVPKWLSNQPQLVLQVGLNMTIAIPDLKVDDEGISCTLSFQRTPVWCRMPWASIWALVGESQRGMVWPEDVPPEVAAQQQKAGSAAPKEKAKKPRPRLAAVGPAERSGSEPDAEQAQAQAERAERAERLDEAAEAAPEAPAARQPAPAAAAAAAREETPSADADAGEGEAAGPGARPGAKPKRELPPYLRVIK